MRLGLVPTSRLSAVDAAKNLGIRVVHPHQLPSIPPELLNELENGSSENWSTVYLPIPSQPQHLIINNRKHPPAGKKPTCSMNWDIACASTNRTRLRLSMAFPSANFAGKRKSKRTLSVAHCSFQGVPCFPLGSGIGPRRRSAPNIALVATAPKWPEEKYRR